MRPADPALAGGRDVAGASHARRVACALAAPPAWAQVYRSLDLALNEIIGEIVDDGGLRGRAVLVSPNSFIEMGTGRNLRLSSLLARRSVPQLRCQGARPVSGSDDEDRAVTLRGEWSIEHESGGPYLYLFMEAKQLVGNNELRTLASEHGRVPVASIDRRSLEPDIESHGRHVVHKLEQSIAGADGRYVLRVRPFVLQGMAKSESERFNRYLLGKWRPAFADSRRFRLGGPARFDGELFGDVFIVGERIEVSLYIRDDQEREVAAATVEMDRNLFPPGMFGPDVRKLLARCAGEADAGRLGVARRCYEEARASAPGDSDVGEGVRAGLERIAGLEEEARAVGDVEEAIGRGTLDEARRRLEDLKRLNAGHSRLAELERGLARAERRAEAERERTVGRRFRDCAGCPELVVVPSGTYKMGSPAGEEGRDDDEGPVHEVTFARPFAVGVHEVTRGEFARFVSSTGRSMGDSCRTYEGGEWEERSGRDWRSPGFSQTDAHPVVCVSWEDAKGYVGWLSRETGKEYRLLSESEWEYVARGGRRTARYWGESEGGQCRYANGADREAKRHNSGWTTVNCSDGHYRTAPVGSYEANGYKLHDVLGNVWEWVEDCWNGDYHGAPSDGSAWESGNCGTRVLRGGSWSDEPGNLRSAYRDGSFTGNRLSRAGFRVARTLD